MASSVVVEGPPPSPPPCWPPQTEWLAEYNQRSGYNEAEIVGLIKEIFDLLILFGYVEADQIDWAPPTGHPINETLCDEFRLEKPVISLMKKLPYIKLGPEIYGPYEFNLFPASPQIRYLEDQQFRNGREAEMGHEANTVEVQDLVLTDCMMYGTSIILDTRENVIRLVSPQYGQPTQYPLAKPELERHYRNAFARHAPSFLQRHIDRIRSLSLIPIHSKGLGVLRETADHCDEIFHEYLNPRMKEILRGSFGYPDNFRRTQWVAECEPIWERIMKEVAEEFGDM